MTSKKQTLKKERGKLSITKEILRHYLNRENWKKKELVPWQLRHESCSIVEISQLGGIH